jgi:transcriptional regulator with PAS, ATPase and Fis domain
MTSFDTDTKRPSQPAAAQRGGTLRLVFSAGEVFIPAPIWRVPRAGLAIGREVERGLRLQGDTRLSRHHATISLDGESTLRIVDQGSKNGTWVNGQRQSEAALRLGDIVSIGDSSLVVGADPLEEPGPSIPTLVGDSAAMHRVRAAIRKLGPTSTTVLLTGETGCGKELAARAIHDESGASGAFIAVNCAAIPDNLFESQFFGHRAGAFTGAAAHEGFFRAAHRGTLFLDEIGELPPPQQAKLLRAIQERAVIPLGSTRAVACDVRFVSATNRNLVEAVESGAFRADLLARLFEGRLHLPPVRERPEDILELFAHGFDSALPPMPHALAEELLLHPWPYNVREVIATARALAAESQGAPRLDVETFRRRLVELERSGPARQKPSSSPRSGGQPLDPLELSRVLAKNAGSVAQVAREVGRSRRQIYRWIQKHGIDVNLFRRTEEADRS